MSFEQIREDPPPLPPSPIAEWLQEVRGWDPGWYRYPKPASRGAQTHIATGSRYGARKGEFETRGAKAEPEHGDRIWLWVRKIQDSS